MLADALAPFTAPSASIPHDAALCAHCGQPVPGGTAGQEPLFCCNGCASVYAILRSSGLEAYYERRDEVGARGQVANVTGKAYAELAEPEFEKLYCRRLSDGRLTTELFLENVHCAACVWLVEKVSAVVPGVSEARLDLSRSMVRLAWDPSAANLARIAQFLDSIGYPCHPLHGLDRDAIRRREDRRLLVKMGVAGACAGNAMLLAVALYCGAFSEMEPAYVDLFRWGSVVVALPSILWSATVFYRGALAALRTLTPHMDLPISIGIVAGSVSGIESTLHASGEVFFDTITMLVFLLLVGRWLQQRQQRRADAAADHLRALAPATARVVGSDGAAHEVRVETVAVGAVVEVRPGDQVPVDGTVIAGESSLDVSLLTGESLPLEVRPGAFVHAGSLNVAAPLRVRADKTGHETRLARLVDAVAEAADRRAPLVVLANRLSGYFVVGVLTVAALTVAVLWHRGPAVAVGRAVALLVVTCPCALGLATPLAVTAALGRAARDGLMVKGGQFLEALAHPGLVVFDKTGTLTQGKLSLVEFVGDTSAQAHAAAAEAGSAHPIARALSAAFDARGLACTSMKETLGGGVTAVVSGRDVVVGSLAHVERSCEIPESLREHAARFAARALTPVFIAIGGRALAVAAIGDPVRPEARECIEKLRALGHRVSVLSGDQPAVVRAVADRIGVAFEDVIGGATPETKLAFVEARAKRGRVFMVGDGVNDAGALSAATVGIAVRGGAEASLAAADVFATKPGLRPLVELFEGAGRTLRVIRGNLLRSLVYNLTVGALAATGYVGPLLAALLMPVSSIGVITSSYRSHTFGARK
jgi:Cu2+-exporting ATPase